MSIKVVGLSPLVNAFAKAGPDVARFARTAIWEEANEAFLISQAIVPVRTGALLTSGRVEAPSFRGDKVSCDIVYGGPAAPYALYVHEIPPGKAKHDYPTRWKFLENPVKLYSNGMEERIAKRVLNMVWERNFS